MSNQDPNKPNTPISDSPINQLLSEQIRNNISKRIEYDFKDKTLLEEALTHPSAKVLLGIVKNSERLEFLGDSVLNLAVSDMLFRAFPSEKEGALTIRKVGLTCSETIAKVATKLKLRKYIIVNKNFEINKSTLENTTEALIGAIFIDGGFDSAKKFVTRHWEEFVFSSDAEEDAKSALQVWTTKRKHPLPEYTVVRRTGPDHHPRFTVSAKVGNLGQAMASATTKRLAEHKVAKALLERIKRTEDLAKKESAVENQL